MGTKAANREAVKTGPYKDFGLWMKSLRKRLKLSQEAAERKAKSKDVTQAKLTHAERGFVPDPTLLKALASVYRVPHEAIVQRWVQARYGVTLSITSDTADLLHRNAPSGARGVSDETQKAAEVLRGTAGAPLPITVLKPGQSDESDQKGETTMPWRIRVIAGYVAGLQEAADPLLNAFIDQLHEETLRRRRGIRETDPDISTG